MTYNLTQAWKNYIAIVYEQAEREFELEILPWLQKYSLTFVAGMGTFFIGYTDNTPDWFIDRYAYYPKGSRKGDRQLNIDKLPRKIEEILLIDVDGINNNLGSLMPDYEGETTCGSN